MNTTNAQFEKVQTVMSEMVKPFIFELHDILPENDVAFVIVRAACIVLKGIGINKQAALHLISRSLDNTYKGGNND